MCQSVGTQSAYDVCMKRCAQCHEHKSIEEFSWKIKRLGTLATYCKPCMRAYCKSHYRKNGHKHNARRYENTKAYRVRNRTFIIEYLAEHPCVDCGERDIAVLEFDHVRGQKRGNISEIVSAGWSLDYLQCEIAKCVVRCSNCHRRKTVRQFAWFKSIGPREKRNESTSGRSSAW